MGWRTFARARRAAVPLAVMTLPLGMLAALAASPASAATGSRAAASDASASGATPTLQQAFDNVGITAASDATAGNYDGIGDSFSASGLAADALSPGQTLLHDGLTITWPDVAPGQPDNVVADGQTVSVAGAGTTLGVVGASAYGSTGGTFTVTYANGTTSTSTVTLADWIDTSPAAGTDLLATTAGWNPGGTIPVSLSYAAIPLTAGQPVVSVTLPAVGSGVGENVSAMHVFSLTIGSPGAEAAGAPGAASYYDEARKDCVGTAADQSSKVWYTVADGTLSDVYAPTIDNTDVKSLDPIVTGPGFTALQPRDMTYTVSSLDGSGMACQVTAHDAAHDFNVVTDFITDPAAEAVVMRFTLVPLPGAPSGLHLYLRFNPLLNGHGGGGSDNAGGESATVVATLRGPVPLSYSTNSFTEAVNRSYATPIYAALAASQPFQAVETGFEGTASDGLTELDNSGALTSTAPDASNGNVVQTVELAGDTGTVALGFGGSEHGALRTAQAAAAASFPSVYGAYQAGWHAYDGTLRSPESFGHVDAAQRRAYYLSANVLKASEDKTFAGATAASLASPWGQAVPAGQTASDGLAPYFGSYREVFPRDAYETFTGFLTDGDLATARQIVTYMFSRLQLPNGSFPRNGLLNGAAAPDTGGLQLDETADPILAAWQAGMAGDRSLYVSHIRPAADFLVANGPTDGVERWEEQTGFSPSTMADEVAGLTAASVIAKTQGDTARARLYQATADDFQRMIKTWTVTTTGPDGPSYFIRVSKTGDPNAAISYSLGNGGPTVDQRSVIDGGFQELTRLGELPISDPDIQASLGVLDKQVSVVTPSGSGYYRYGTSAAKGSADGYGDCFQPSQTSCTTTGAPWPPTDTGTGHLWPNLSGERAESDLAAGGPAKATALLQAMMNFSSGVGLVPEQAWEDPDLAASPFGSDPATASIGFTDGKAAGSASPLTWAQAQELRLILSLGTGRNVDTPAVTTARYVTNGPPTALPVTITSPASTATLAATSTAVTGTTAPGASVTVAADD